MGIYKRKDGKIIKKLPSYMKFFPFIMPDRVGSSVYFKQEIVLDKTLSYCNVNDVKIFHVFIASLLRLGQDKPIFNRFVIGKRTYQRDHLSVCFIAKKDLSEESSESSVKVFFDNDDRLHQVIEKVQTSIDDIRNGRIDQTDKSIDLLTSLPKWITSLIFKVINVLNHFGLLSKKFMDDNPLFSTAYVTNVGSIGIDAPYHHLYEFGTTSIFASLGKIKEKAVVVNGEVVVKKVVNVNFTIDERIADGVYMAKALGKFVDYMEDPELLE